ncbi:MAG: hypothetical protein QW688_08300 [Thermoprotei archaeon]
MSTNSLDNHATGILGAVIYAVLGALMGYALGYTLLLLAGQNYIIASTANLTATHAVNNIVTAQYAGASILPYLFAFLLATLGFAYGYLRHK